MTRVKNFLPGETLATMLSQHERQIITGYTGSRRKILLVDDKPENLMVLQDMLHPLGFELIEARNGEEAIQQALEFRPDVILMDLLMPVLDGFEATCRLQEYPIEKTA